MNAASSSPLHLSVALAPRDLATQQIGLRSSARIRNGPRTLRHWRKPDGYLVLVNQPAGPTTLAISAQGYFPAEANVTIEAAPSVDQALVPISMIPRPSYPFIAGSTLIRGKVTGPDGQPITDAGIIAKVGGEIVRSRSDTAPAWAGVFALALPMMRTSKTVELQASHPDFHTQIRNVKPDLGGSVTCNFELASSGTGDR